MTDAFIFAGPTLPLTILKEKLGEMTEGCFTLPNAKKITVLPPVSEGDVHAVAKKKPGLIAIVDGYFENVPAVWHKEILHAMHGGIHVMGSSSMGALRAAELHTFGMEGIGAIYQAFAEGRWEDDDEVTVVHGPAELGFPALSEAMVNIRFTLDAAARDNILSAAEWSGLMQIAKQLHYKDRNYRNIMYTAREKGLAADRLARFEEWLVCNRKDQKLSDAIELLDKVVQRLAGPPEKKKVLYHFEDTIIWHNARRASP